MGELVLGLLAARYVTRDAFDGFDLTRRAVDEAEPLLHPHA